ncbi:hypothetical protein DOY81_008271, partial [Sarcophaga bullata]
NLSSTVNFSDVVNFRFSDFLQHVVNLFAFGYKFFYFLAPLFIEHDEITCVNH